MSEIFIHAKDLWCSYDADDGGKQRVLRGVTLDIKKGARVSPDRRCAHHAYKYGWFPHGHAHRPP